ncbi:hypothetical protein FB45DRAFT_905501 [Roridomyces roridus]|uniref:F-box domain-containing protein n=1 Tax=Roridomyces roridus TaxID=1738132 RepID=A0AAD7C5Q6_9AGAR|nr:hypothetical protein FB45DRAFT_905501 [Roridomyces roridus]
MSTTIHSLSPEVLALIFEWCCQSDSEPLVPSAAAGPLLVARISRHWRSVALSTPVLWCSLSFRLKKLGETLPFLKTWLERSGSCPLTLNLAYKSPRRAWEKPTVLPVVDILCLHAHQFEWLRLHLPCSDLVRLGQLAFPRLRRLDYSLVDRETELPDIDLFTCTPQLSELYTTGYAVCALLAQKQFPWTQLTTFRCSYYNLYDCLQVFRLAPSLQHCALVVEHPAAFHRPIATISPLPHLRSFSLKGGWTDTQILCQLQLPGLHELSFSVSRTSQLTPLISRCPSIRILELRLYALPEDVPPILEYFRSLSSLVQLQVHGHGFRSHILVAVLEALENDGSFLPRLETLHFECTSESGLYPSLVKMLVQAKTLRPLSTVSFHFTQSVGVLEKQDDSAIAALRRDGVDIRFS